MNKVNDVLEAMELEHRCRLINHVPSPRRHLWLEIAAHADDLPGLVESLRNILENIERGCPGGVCGSGSMGSHYRLIVDPTVTPASYQEALSNYLKMIRTEVGDR